jgi:hypothetical protein
MKTELVLFGKRFNMASQIRRRRLVVVFYGIFGALLIANWLMGSHTGGGWITIEFTLLVGPILGGYFARIGVLSQGRGLVAPFEPQKILKYPKSATILKPSTLLHPVVDNDPELRIDERSVRRRDHAHYVSHGWLGSILALGFILEYGNYSSISIGLSSDSIHRMVYYLLQIGYILSMTLPQAILLWTEPDMEPEP